MRPTTTPNRRTRSGKQNLTGWAVAFLLLIAAGTATAQSYNAEKFAREVARNSELNCPKALNGLVVDSLSYRAGTDRFQIHFPHDTLQLLYDKASRITIAEDSMMGKFMDLTILHDQERWQKEIDENPEMYTSADVSHQDRRILINLTVKEEAMNFNMTPEEFQTMKNHIARLLHEGIDAMNWTIRSRFASNDAEIQYLLLVCVRSGYGICYRYEPVAPTQNTKKKAKRSKKKDVVNLCFPPEELKGFLRE